MGCCLTTASAPKGDPHHPNVSNSHHFPAKSLSPKSDKAHVTNAPNNRAPPPSLEEESVKEVLSETPIPKPPSPTIENHRKTQMPTLQEDKIHRKDFTNKLEETSEVSQVSEICSITESFSTTTTIAEKMEDEAMSKQSRQVNPRVNRSPAKKSRKRPYTGELAIGRERGAKSPARKAEPLPEKRGQVTSRSARGRESGQVRSMQRTVGPTGSRRDYGEGSGRRSRSPATRTVGGVGRGGRVGSPMKVSGRGGGRTGDLGVENGGKEESNDGVLQQQGNESLDNPHVSLECFIFL